jgi:hypothetical protein
MIDANQKLTTKETLPSIITNTHYSCAQKECCSLHRHVERTVYAER